MAGAGHLAGGGGDGGEVFSQQIAAPQIGQHRGALQRPVGQGQAAVVLQVGARAAVHGQQDLAVQRHHP